MSEKTMPEKYPELYLSAGREFEDVDGTSVFYVETYKFMGLTFHKFHCPAKGLTASIEAGDYRRRFRDGALKIKRPTGGVT